MSAQLTAKESILRNVYKANQCTDLNDVNIALETLIEKSKGLRTKAIVRRMNSLLNKKKKLLV